MYFEAGGIFRHDLRLKSLLSSLRYTFSGFVSHAWTRSVKYMCGAAAGPRRVTLLLLRPHNVTPHLLVWHDGHVNNIHLNFSILWRTILSVYCVANSKSECFLSVSLKANSTFHLSRHRRNHNTSEDIHFSHLKALKQHTAVEGHGKSTVNICLIYPFQLENTHSGTVAAAGYCMSEY